MAELSSGELPLTFTTGCDDRETAEVLNNYFSSVFVREKEVIIQGIDFLNLGHVMLNKILHLFIVAM